MQDLVSLLEGLILSHPNLKVEDRAVVSRLCFLIRIEDTGDINEYYRLQVQAEAGAVYLKGRYDAISARLRKSLDNHRAGRSVELGSRDDEGLRWTKLSQEQWLLGTDPKYVVLNEMFREAERLHSLIKGLSDIVINRNGKLEQLAINYRREVEVDRRTSF